MKDWLEIAGIALGTCVALGTVPMLLLYWLRQRDKERQREREAMAALHARIEQLEVAVRSPDHVT